MSLSVWALMIAAVAAEGAAISALGYGLWSMLDADGRAVFVSVATANAGLLALAVLAVCAIPVMFIALFVRRYAAPLPPLAEATRMIALSNPRHRLAGEGAAEVQDVAAAVNLLADQFQGLRDDVEARIHDTNAALEEERNTLAALMLKLTQGVLVCTADGRIMLYNHLAQSLLGGDGADWIGLGRSVYGVLDQDVLAHALSHVNHRLAAGETALLVPFVAKRSGGQLLSVHLVPILATDRSLRGYILTLDDITRRSGAEHRRGALMQSLIQGQRSSIGGIRAAIEIVLGNPDLITTTRQQFLDVISEESTKLSEQLDQLQAEYAPGLKVHGPQEEILASDLLEAIHRRVKDATGLDIEVSVPLEPVWLRADSYEIAQVVSFLVGRIGPTCRATDFEIHLEEKRRLAALVLEWTGAALDMEALKTWWDLTVVSSGQQQSYTLFDVIERHGGATWARAATAGRRPGLHLVLPVSETDAARNTTPDNDAMGPDFDFRLFAETSAGDDIAALPLGKLHYTVIDTETTGLDPAAGDEIIAIGAVRIVNGRMLKRETFDSFVNPRRSISSASQAIHGISPSMLRTMPTIEEVLPRLARFVGDSVIVGHNVASDMRFLQMKEAATGIVFANPFLDTLLLEHIANPSTGDKSLEGIAARLGITVTGRHTALGDALTTAEIFLALLPVLASKGIMTLEDARHACNTHALVSMTQ